MTEEAAVTPGAVPSPQQIAAAARVFGKGLLEMTLQVHELNVAHGWFDASRDIGMDIALLHSEVTEMLEAVRTRGVTPYTTPEGKPDDFGSECADVLIRLLDTCYRTGIDLEAEYTRKMAYNKTRPFKHGRLF